jgi:superfamily II DNA helicase RecQ
VFITPESAVTKIFTGFMNRLQKIYRLNRIIFDEYHTTLDGSPSFRLKLRELGKLVLRGMQIVYLIIILPPREKEEFYRLAHIQKE